MKIVITNLLRLYQFKCQIPTARRSNAKDSIFLSIKLSIRKKPTRSISQRLGKCHLIQKRTDRSNLVNFLLLEILNIAESYFYHNRSKPFQTMTQTEI